MPFTQLASGPATFSGATGAGHVYTFPIGAVAVGDLLILGCNVHNGTASTPTGYLVAGSNTATTQGAYCWYKIATGGETSATIITNADREVSLSFLRYSGAATSAVLDKVDVKTGTSQQFLGYNFTIGISKLGIDSTNTSPLVSPATLAMAGELAILFEFNDTSSLSTALTPTWPVGYSDHVNTGPSTSGLGSPNTTQHFTAAFTNASGIQTPQITWTGGGFVNCVSMFVSFLPKTATGSEFGSSTFGLTNSATISRKAKLASTATVGLTVPSAGITKRTSIDPSIRIIAVMEAILSAVETALLSTPGGAIARPVLAPSAGQVNIDDQLSVTVDRKFHVSTQVFRPDATDTGFYLVVVIVVSILRVLPDELSLTAATKISVTDAVIVQSTTAATLATLGSSIDGFQMGTQHYGESGSSLLTSIRLVL
jgi:hypothetical protein